MKGRKERRKRAKEEGGEEGKVRERTEGRGREGGKKEEEGQLQYERSVRDARHGSCGGRQRRGLIPGTELDSALPTPYSACFLSSPVSLQHLSRFASSGKEMTVL